MYPFRMYGRLIEIYRYQVDYKENIDEVDEDGNVVEKQVSFTDYFPTKEMAEDVAVLKKGKILELDSTSYEWLDKIEVDDVPDTYAEAVKIFEMGENTYKEKSEKPSVEEELAVLNEKLNSLLRDKSVW